MIGLHRQRADVLTALALAARGREPIDRALDRLAAIDTSLGGWTSRLSPQLKAGEPLCDVLWRERLLGAEESHELAVSGDPAGTLQRLAVRAQEPPGRTWYLIHPGTAIALCLLAPFVVISAVRAMWPALLDIPEFQMYQQPRFPALDAVIFGVLLALVEHGIGAVRGLRHLRALWCAEIMREQALLRLIRSARTGDEREVHLNPLQRALSWVGCWPHHDGRPRWDAAWRTWSMLTWFRNPRAARQTVRECPSLDQRLIAAGVVSQGPDGPDWQGAEQACSDRLLSAIMRKRAIVRPIMLLAGYIGICIGLVLIFDTGLILLYSLANSGV